MLHIYDGKNTYSFWGNTSNREFAAQRLVFNAAANTFTCETKTSRPFEEQTDDTATLSSAGNKIINGSVGHFNKKVTI